MGPGTKPYDGVEIILLLFFYYINKQFWVYTLIFYILAHYHNFFTMQEGTVKFFNEAKGFGFITSNGQDIFVHISGLNPGVTIRENDKVSFDVQNGKKGLNAVNVQPL